MPPDENMSKWLNAGGDGPIGENLENVVKDSKLVDVVFEKVSYSVLEANVETKTFGWKQLLFDVSGDFKSGQLSLIMGPSGAGKTTLLNVLAGFRVRNSKGDIRYNGRRRQEFSNPEKLIAYIPQEEMLRNFLTVYEVMLVAAHLKLGFNVNMKTKASKIEAILNILGLEQTRQVRVENLSGGQKKRLSIATELLTDPAVLFLDEPTTGLDSYSCAHCVQLLKDLAKQGRTVICTIHQPSALLFEKFDKLYALTEGRCIYNGLVKNFVTQYAQYGMDCPSYHNPADFLIEVASKQYDYDLEAVQNNTAIETEVTLSNYVYPWNSSAKYVSHSQPPNILMQFVLLTQRNYLITYRDYCFILIKLFAHLIIALLFGYMYYDVGNSALNVLGNGSYAYGSSLLLLYTSQMSVMLKFPMEVNALSIEHFNGWYKLFPYFMSLLAVEIPFQFFCVMVYLFTSYYLTGQPLEIDRMTWIVILALIMILCSQSWGYFFGAVLPVKLGVFIGPVLICAFSVFGFCMSYDQTPLYLKWMYFLSYFRAGFHNMAEVILGLGRKNLYCPEETEYCHYVNPKEFLTDMGIVDVDLIGNCVMLCCMTASLLLMTFATLWFKLNKR